MTMSSMIRIRNERLHDPEEGYKKGGKVRKGKKKAKAKKSRKATGKRRRAVKAEAQRYLPMGGTVPTTGMGSFVFGPSQAPSYFRSAGPDQQTFASIPRALQTIQEGQAQTLRKLQYFEDEGKRQYERQQEFNREVIEDYEQRMRQQRAPKASISVQSSRAPTPRASYSPIVSSSSFMPPPINTLLPLERQRSMTPDIITPMIAPPASMSSSIPDTAVRTYSWSQALSSREAGYRGADESLPIQAPASGANMVPEDIVYDAVPDSAFVPLNAAAPESVDAAVERAGQVAAQAATPIRRIPKPKVLIPIPAPEPEPEPEPEPAKPASSGSIYMKNPDTVTSRDTLHFIASGLGIKNAKANFTGPGSTQRLREAIKEAQRGRQ